MQNSVVFIISILTIISCVLKKETNVEENIPHANIRPILIPKQTDTNFIFGNVKVKLYCEYWNFGNENKTFALTEYTEDTVLHIVRKRDFYSDTTLMSEETSEWEQTSYFFRGLFLSINKMGRYNYLLDCDSKGILKHKDPRVTIVFNQGKQKVQEFIDKNYGIQDRNLVTFNFQNIIYLVQNDRLNLTDSLLLYEYDLVLKDKKRISYFTVFYNHFLNSVHVNGTILKNLKPINLKYSEIESLINQVDSIETIDDFMEVVVDSVNNDILLKVNAKKKYKKTGERTSIHTKVVFHVNVHTKEVTKISEKKYESIWAE